MSTSTKVLAGSIFALGLGIAVLLPNGHVCRERGVVEVRRQWSYTQERFFYGCYLTPELTASIDDRGVPYHPMGAHTDWRIWFRVGALAYGLLIAWIIVRTQDRATGTIAIQPWVFVAFYALAGAVIALLLTLQADSYCIRQGRGPGSLSCSYRSFFGWDAEPMVVEVLFALVGAVVGAAAGVLVAGWVRRDRPGTIGLVDEAPGRTED